MPGRNRGGPADIERAMPPRRRSPLLIALAALAVLTGVGVLAVQSCVGGRQLVEVFDNGPVGGPPGGSEGYRWVRKGDLPPAGKGWRITDPATLTPEQRARIR